MVAGPDAVVQIVPWSATLVQVLYWPVVIVLSVVFLTTLYHVSVPVRSPWVEDVPGALVALAMWVFGSFLLRIYLTSTVEGPTIYGSLAFRRPRGRPPVDRCLRVRRPRRRRRQRGHRPGLAGRRHGRSRADRAPASGAGRRVHHRAAAHRAGDPDPDDPDMPSEFPERWSRFLPGGRDLPPPHPRQRLHHRKNNDDNRAGRMDAPREAPPQGRGELRAQPPPTRTRRTHPGGLGAEPPGGGGTGTPFHAPPTAASRANAVKSRGSRPEPGAHPPKGGSCARRAGSRRARRGTRPPPPAPRARPADRRTGAPSPGRYVSSPVAAAISPTTSRKLSSQEPETASSCRTYRSPPVSTATTTSAMSRTSTNGSRTSPAGNTVPRGAAPPPAAPR